MATETYPFWHQQTTDKPLYPNIEWSKPQQRSLSGRLGIIGGNSSGFAGLAEAYSKSLAAGIGEARILLPDNLKKNIPSNMTDVIYGASNPSGGLARDALPEMKALGEWASGILLIGDAGRNSETAIVYEDFIRDYAGPLIIARDAVDLTKNSSSILVDRPQTLIVASFAQLQKLFRTIYYPKMLTFSMQLTSLVEDIHKFTTTYPINIVVFHQDTLLLASGGEVTSTPWSDPMSIWRGDVATRAAAYWLWNLSKPLDSITASFVAS
jgi:NAD(P)H-hydrate repair Nnr-like enzyme with NAD(P)H-hydrate dehydratase domain